MLLLKIRIIIKGKFDKWIRSRRSQSLAKRSMFCGNNLNVDCDCYFSGIEKIAFGDNVIINRGVILQAHSSASNTIGNNCVISYRSQLLTGGRKVIKEIGISKEHIYRDIKIGNNVWIGANSIILPGVVVEDNVVIAAGTVVTKSLDSGYIYGGVPAKLIKKI